MLPKLADFGIAKWTVDDDHAKTNIAEDTAIVAGQKLAMYSPSWAAPEQLAGQPVQPSTDIYSLACVAIYMISGRAIFADEDVYAGYKKRRNADTLVRETLVPLGLPRTVIDALSRALAFDPKKRLTRVEELANELTVALEPSTDEQLRLATPPTGSDIPLTPTRPVRALTPPDGAPAHAASAAPSAPAASPHAQTGQLAAPTPPAAYGVDPMPATFHAPATLAWMAHAPAPNGLPRRLALSDVPQVAGDRRVHFVMTAEAADVAGHHGIKIRVTLLPGATGQRVAHLKGLSCFVAPLGGRPSPAITLDRSADVAIVTPRAQEIGHLRVAQGTPAMGQTVFPLGGELVAVAADDCNDPILFDFGPGSDAYFVYTRGRAPPKSGRRG
jgi:serine/threonine-protein kinase